MQSYHEALDHEDGRAGLTRGILVIVTAVAVGAFVLSRATDNGSVDAAIQTAAVGSGTTGELAEGSANPDEGTDPAAGAITATTVIVTTTVPTTAAPVETSTSTTVAESPTPAGPAIAAPADVKVLVLNAEGTKGIAGRGSAQLDDAGYDVLAPRNADELADASSVLFVEGSQAEAEAVAAVFDAGPELVQALDPNNPPFNELGDAMVIVIIGKDGALGL